MNKNQIKQYCVIGIIAAAVWLFVMHVTTVIGAVSTVLTAAAPLILGVVIAYILNILLSRIEKIYFPKSKNTSVIKSRRPVCIVLSFF